MVLTRISYFLFQQPTKSVCHSLRPIAAHWLACLFFFVLLCDLASNVYLVLCTLYPQKAPKPSSPEVPISPILPDKQRSSATRHSGAQFKQTNDEFVDKYDACDPLNEIQDVGKPSSSSSSGTARNPALAKVSRQRLSAVMKKPVQSNRVPSKVGNYVPPGM